ncbi:peptidylprolyl isomerase [Rhizorhabdus dicambivorans]|nr:peptidylprolyl isomerase [Rhizorhabdus dicambivorans]
MITFFRKALSSWIALGILALVMIAFIITGVESPSMMGGGSTSGGTIAKVGGERIGGAELARLIQNQIDGIRRQQPSFDQKTFLAQGGFEGVTEGLIGGRAVEVWGKEHGFAVGKRLIDAEIAGNPAFRGITGQFDENVMRNMLAQARISEKDMRANIAGDLLRNQILTPVAAIAIPPVKVARPYAALMLEERIGSVGIIPLAALADPRPPSEAEIAAAYKADIAAYTRPEARVLRYALFGAEQVAASAAPTEADIAAYYRENAATYAARETRSLTQLITPNEAQARAIAAAAKGGASLSAAATKAGLEAVSIANQSREDYAKAAGAAVAGQVFATAKGGLAGPIKGSFGWYVVRVDTVTGTPARSLEQARPEIVTLLSARKSQEALADLAGRIEDAIADGGSLAEIAANNKLTVVETPPILANGQPVSAPAGWTPPAELNALLKTGFESDPSDRPTVETVIQEQRFALLGIARVIPPTPLPLAQVKPLVMRDIIAKRAAQRAKAIGEKVTAAVNRGVPLAKAMAETGVRLPPPAPARAKQIEIARAQQGGAQIPPPVQALFALQKGKAKLIPSDRGDALFVTVLDNVIPGDLATNPQLLQQMRGDLQRVLTPELGEQFIRAAGAEVKIKRYPDAIAAVKRQIAGQ